MMVFALTPAMAPLVGAGMIALAGWRAVFGAFALFALILSGWMMLRLPEPLPPARRSPFRLRPLGLALRTVVAHPVTRRAILVQMLGMTTLFTSLSVVQPTFQTTFGRGGEFPFWFFGMALIAGSGSLVNARLVGRFGMVRMVRAALCVQVGLTALAILAGRSACRRGRSSACSWSGRPGCSRRRALPSAISTRWRWRRWARSPAWRRA